MIYSGHGMSACIVDLALRSMGNLNSMIYLGSWKQYATEEEPNFNSGHWSTPTNILVEESFRAMGEDRYH
jgi:hypothetical protein